MAVRDILKGKTNPRLRKKSKPVSEINDRIVQLVGDMKDTLKKEEGVGLAAPQVGVLRRIIIVDNGDGPFEIINPELSNKEGSSIEKEGCLSLLPISGYVERPKKLKVKGLKLNGDKINIDAEDLLARIICHEVDHLEGILFSDKIIPEEDLEPMDDEKAESKVEEL